MKYIVEIPAGMDQEEAFGKIEQSLARKESQAVFNDLVDIGMTVTDPFSAPQHEEARIDVNSVGVDVRRDVYTIHPKPPKYTPGRLIHTNHFRGPFKHVFGNEFVKGLVGNKWSGGRCLGCVLEGYPEFTKNGGSDSAQVRICSSHTGIGGLGLSAGATFVKDIVFSGPNHSVSIRGHVECIRAWQLDGTISSGMSEAEFGLETRVSIHSSNGQYLNSVQNTIWVPPVNRYSPHGNPQLIGSMSGCAPHSQPFQVRFAPAVAPGTYQIWFSLDMYASALNGRASIGGIVRIP